MEFLRSLLPRRFAWAHDQNGDLAKRRLLSQAIDYSEIRNRYIILNDSFIEAGSGVLTLQNCSDRQTSFASKCRASGRPWEEIRQYGTRFTRRRLRKN